MENKNDERMDKANNELEGYTRQIQEISSFNEFPKMDHNPFMHLLGSVIKMDYKTVGVMNGVGIIEYTDMKTGEIKNAQENKVFRSRELVDSDKFLKIYNAQLKEMFSLTHPALKVFGYFIREMQNSKDSVDVYFRLQECMDFCGYDTHAMVYRGLTELIKKLFICKTDRPPHFYVNPLYAFNGNRISIFKEYIRNDYFDNEPKQLGNNENRE